MTTGRHDLDEVMRGTGHPVARIELHHFTAPLPTALHPAWIPGMAVDELRATLIRVVTADGVDGWSAVPAIGREHAGLGDLIGPEFIGEDATDIHLVQQHLREIAYLGWRNWWIEPAFWDIKAKIAGEPLWRLLGGDAPETVAAYASSAEVRDPDERIREAERRAAEGFDLLKIRVHEDEVADTRQITETARAVGDAIGLAVDANQGWRIAAIADAPRWDLDRARRCAAVCADHGVAWLEEPLPMDAYADLCTLRRETDVAIAGGELHSSGAPELAMMIDRGCYDLYQPDALHTGGVAQTLRVAERCRAEGLRFAPSSWTTGIGLVVALHVLVASGYAGDEALEYPVDTPAWPPEARDAMLVEPLVAEDGRLPVPDRPGLGIAIDRRAVRRNARRFYVGDRRRGGGSARGGPGGAPPPPPRARGCSSPCARSSAPRRRSSRGRSPFS
jgi:D-galactarolactone cycloisomerase